jgi:protease I
MSAGGGVAQTGMSKSRMKTGVQTMSDLKGMRVAILATDGVEQSELTEPRKFLEQLGAQTTVLSPKAGQIQAMQQDEKADKLRVDRVLEGANPAEYDAVLLPGGALNADSLRVNSEAQRFVEAIDHARKPVAAICHAPWLLVSAGLTRGRKMTSYHTIQDDLRNAGVDWKDEQVVQDRNWVSSRRPSDIPAFNRAMAELFSQATRNKVA